MREEVLRLCRPLDGGEKHLILWSRPVSPAQLPVIEAVLAGATVISFDTIPRKWALIERYEMPEIVEEPHLASDKPCPTCGGRGYKSVRCGVGMNREACTLSGYARFMPITNTHNGDDGTRNLREVPPAQHQAYRDILERAEQVYLERGAKNGVTPFRPVHILSLIQTKLWRLERGELDDDEWLDILNYSAIGLMVCAGTWEGK